VVTRASLLLQQQTPAEAVTQNNDTWQERTIRSWNCLQSSDLTAGSAADAAVSVLLNQ